MTVIHWVGTGLSSVPGIRRLVKKKFDVVIWNRTRSKALDLLGDLTNNIKEFDLDGLSESLKQGDIVVSMLPGNWHVPIAQKCLEKNSHFACSSYISPEMKALDPFVKEKKLIFVNEIGLDPGIDHLMSHKLIKDYKESESFDQKNDVSFTSYCGGIPKIPNSFRYKFSWSPVGVLKALKAPSKSIKEFETFDVRRPWNYIRSYQAPLKVPETFEVYANRDSLPFMKDYNFDPDWNVKRFVRGTLRLKGWSDAWSDIFKRIESFADNEHGELELEELSKTLWKENAYGDSEPDRVVLCVGLAAENTESLCYKKTFVLDAQGDQYSSAMARLVSIPLSLAVEAIISEKLPSGVIAATSNQALIDNWLSEVSLLVDYLDLIDHIR